jgi:hypothetical protein
MSHEENLWIVKFHIQSCGYWILTRLHKENISWSQDLPSLASTHIASYLKFVDDLLEQQVA